MKPIRVGKWLIEYCIKPIPDRRFDYDVLHDDYDGFEDIDHFFNCGSVEEAKAEIKERNKD